MPRAASRDPIYYLRRCSPEVIERRLRRYLTYKLSDRDLSGMSRKMCNEMPLPRSSTAATRR